jgi:hypothetical protein
MMNMQTHSSQRSVWQIDGKSVQHQAPNLRILARIPDLGPLEDIVVQQGSLVLEHTSHRDLLLLGLQEPRLIDGVW